MVEGVDGKQRRLLRARQACPGEGFFWGEGALCWCGLQAPSTYTSFPEDVVINMQCPVPPPNAVKCW